MNAEEGRLEGERDATRARAVGPGAQADEAQSRRLRLGVVSSSRHLALADAYCLQQVLAVPGVELVLWITHSPAEPRRPRASAWYFERVVPRLLRRLGDERVRDALPADI